MKIVRYKNQTKNEREKKKAANVQRNTFKKDLQKAWRTIAQDHFKRLKESLAAWTENIKKFGLDQDLCIQNLTSKIPSVPGIAMMQ